MLPNLSRPVTRSIQPHQDSSAFFKIEWKKDLVGYTPEHDITEQVGGEPIYQWVVQPGGKSYPNEPMRFLYPVFNENRCYLLAGFSRARCLAGRRR